VGVAILGLVSGCLTTLSFLPQVHRSMRRGHASDLSYGWLILFGTGVSGWCLYGFLKQDFAILVSNGITVMLVLVLLGLKLLEDWGPFEL
jgi:MtN3 and saliva related transmembrane protein